MRFTVGFLALAIVASLALGEDAPPPAVAVTNPAATDAAAVDAKSTVITSTKLTYDYRNGRAIFEENVEVRDPGMLLRCNKLTVHFTDEHDPSTIVAEGAVWMEHGDKLAMSNRADYDAVKGVMVLTGSPRVWRGDDRIEAPEITFFRDDKRIVTKGGSRVVIPDRGGDTKLF